VYNSTVALDAMFADGATQSLVDAARGAAGFTTGAATETGAAAAATEASGACSHADAGALSSARLSCKDSLRPQHSQK
jgi:hypothetical protein